MISLLAGAMGGAVAVVVGIGLVWLVVRDTHSARQAEQPVACSSVLPIRTVEDLHQAEKPEGTVQRAFLTKRFDQKRSALITRFNARAEEERRRPRWGCWRDGATFPGINGLHYNLDPRQCAVDFTLHAGNLGIQKRLQFLELGR
jgi:hypothetical protein